jgi:ribonuclease BN (tRNA processing enzyme)
MTMKVEILGHWVGAPWAAGACSSYVVSSDDATILLDCGSGTLPLLLERGLTQRLDAIVISHMHGDHTMDLLPFAGLAEVGALYPGTPEWKKPRLFVPKEGGVETLVALNDVWYANRESYKAKGGQEEADALPPRFAGAFDLAQYGEEDRLELGDLIVTFQRTHHSAPCFAPRLTDGRATVVYSADAGYAPELAEHARGADLFLCEATFSEAHPYWTEKHGHMTGEEAGRLAAEAGVGRLVLTHLGPDPEVNASNLKDARDQFGGTVDLAQTGSAFYL